MTHIYNLLRPYLRGWPIIILAMLSAYLLASKYLDYVTPMYESTAKLRLADMNEGIPNSNLFKDLDVFATSQKINAEIEIMKSSSLIAKALEKVNFGIEIFRSGNISKTELYEDSPILINPISWDDELLDKEFQLEVKDSLKYSVTKPNGSVYKGRIGDTLMIDQSLVTFKLNTALIEQKKKLPIKDSYLFSIVSLQKQISKINSQLNITSVDKDIPVIRMSYKSSHPKKAALFPNVLAETYIQDYIENKNTAAEITVEFLDDRINEMGKKLSESEKMILDYRKGKEITNIRQETETDLRKISQLKIQQTNLKMSLEAIKDLEQYIDAGKDNFLELAPNFEAFTDLLSTEIVKNIKQLQAEKKDLLLEYTEKDEKVLVIDKKIEDLTSYLKESISNTRKNLATKYTKLQGDIEAAELIFKEVPEKERMMTILNREFEIYQKSYNFLNQKKIEAEIAQAVKIAFHRIITPSKISTTPVSPNRIIIKIVATILGMAGALLFIFIIHSLKARINNPDTVESKSMIPIVTEIPYLKTAKKTSHFFIKAISEWEVKTILQEKDIITFTGYSKKQGAHFTAHHIKNSLAHQNRSLLVLEILTTESSIHSELWNEQRLDKNITQVTVYEESLKQLTTKEWKDMLLEKAKDYDQTVIINSCFNDAFTIPTMAASQLNIICMDTRLTPAKYITEIDLLKEEYQLPNVFFALNRVGYSPNLITELSGYFESVLRKLKKRR